MSQCSQLTEEQIKKTNGCGSSYQLAQLFRIPKQVSREFYCVCCVHDLDYQNMNTLEEKKIADDKLYDAMYYSAYHGRWFQKQFKSKIADIVYQMLSTKLSDKCFEKAKPKQFYFN